jgi:anti-sigma B factor antagonist
MTTDITVRRNGDICILDISGRIVLGSGDIVLRKKMEELLKGGNRLFIFNMTQVPYVDSAGIGETFACKQLAAERGGMVKIVLEPDQPTHRVFKKSLLAQVVEIFSDEEEAIASFASEST